MFVFLFYSGFILLSLFAVACIVVVFVKIIKKHSAQNSILHDEKLYTNFRNKITSLNKCEYCNTEINNDILICPSCGAKISKIIN